MNDALHDLRARQSGVLTRAQVLRAGYTADWLRWRVDSGRWQRLRPGIFVTHDGPVQEEARLWAAVLDAGPGAVAGGHAALWAWQAGPWPKRLDVYVPWSRHPRPRPGVTLHRREGLPDQVAQAPGPPRVRLEVAVLDVAATATHPHEVVDVVLRVAQRRLTTPARLSAELSRRERLHRRTLLLDLLADSAGGVHSPLERRYARHVERAHGLPAGRRNATERHGPTTRYRDVVYWPFGVVVELDGLAAHPAAEAFRDRRRDNAVVREGGAPLRYGWREVTGDPCGVAAEVAGVLTTRGWRGTARACSGACTLASAA